MSARRRSFTRTMGQSLLGAVRNSIPVLVQRMVSSDLVPVMEGFQAKAWFSRAVTWESGVAKRSRPL